MMGRIISFLLIGIAGYYVYKKRFSIMNIILSNNLIRRGFVSAIFSIPGVRNKMMDTVISEAD
ncbi:hypothetical protein [Bacillus sp. 03113]|uniref:hypothetical protein n=1 Tax=Bacillus sp. 03113 TaxID=2578211 RepID=UPI00215D35E8|nr:hypothetical protein [Bacillus sp. 03113]